MVAIFTLQGGVVAGRAQGVRPGAGDEAAGRRQALPPMGGRLPPAGEGTVVRAVAGHAPERSSDAVGQYLQRRLQFHVDAASGRTVITVVDRDTGDIIRQIPPEEMLALARRLDATTGLLLAEHA